jgi:Holliday junction resolvasome RuvABC endonuclease subunit
MLMKREKLKLLALDQSTKVTGYSVWSGAELMKCGIVSAPSCEKNPVERMKYMYDGVKRLIKEHEPNYIVIEQTQFQNSYKVYSLLSQLQGVLFSLFFETDIGFTVIEPTAWKSCFGIVGKGRAAQKASTIQRVRDLYGIDATEDAADAIGIGAWGIKNIKKV